MRMRCLSYKDFEARQKNNECSEVIVQWIALEAPPISYFGLLALFFSSSSLARVAIAAIAACNIF